MGKYTGVNKMFFGNYPEYPLESLIFEFNGGYLTPEGQEYFFKRIRKYFGKKICLRSFTLFHVGFKEISFWLDRKKIGSLTQRWICKIFKDKIEYYALQFAEELTEEFRDNLGIEIKVRIQKINSKEDL